MTEIQEETRWETARIKLNDLGTVPATFSSLIRAIRSDIQKSADSLSHISASEVKRLLRSPATLAPFIEALKEYKANDISGFKEPYKAVISAFKPEEICGIVNCIYLCKQVKKRMDPEEWRFVEEILAPAVTIAGHLGSTIQPIGFERAVFTVSANILGMALFHKSLPKQYSSYRRVLKKNNTYFDPEEELKSFGCSGREVCSLLAQSIALSPPLASEYLQGLTPAPDQRPATATQALSIWMKSLYSKGTAPQEAMDAKWYPNKSDVDIIEALTKRVHALSQQSCWLLAEPDSINFLLKDFASMSGSDSEIELSNSEEDL